MRLSELYFRSHALQLSCGIGVVVASVALVPTVQSAPSSASELFSQGLDFYTKGEFQAASQHFEQSYDAEKSQPTLFAWAQSERLQGHCEKAEQLFSEYIANGSSAKQLKAAYKLTKECEPEAKTEYPTPGPTTGPPITIEKVTPGPEVENLSVQKVSAREPQRSIPLYKRWQLYAGGSLLGIAGGTLLAFNAKGIEEDIERLPDGTEFTNAQTLEDRAEQRILFANISFGAAGVLGLTALWMYFSADESSPDSNVSLLVPTLSSQGVGMTFISPF